MAHEARTIILTHDELVMALNSYRRTHPEFLPIGKVSKCKTHDDVQIIAQLEASCAGFTKELEYTLDALMLVDPLVHFCLENNIRLARDGRKSVIFLEGQPALYVEMGTFIAGGFEA